MKITQAGRRRLAAFGPLALVLLAGGCNNSNGNGGGAASIPLTTNTRMLQQGDSWSWNITGTETPTGQAAETVAGTRQYTVTSVTANGAGGNTVDISETLSLTVNGTTTTSNDTIVETQNSDGSIQETSYTENGTTVNITSNSGYKIPGTFSNGETENGNLVLSNGETETVSIDVTGENGTQVSADGANWNTWNVTGNTSTTDNGQTTTESETYQWAPALGTYVQENLNETEANGTTLSETITLTGTSIPESAWGTNPASARKVSKA